MRRISESRGSITVEASIAMPVFLCIILSIALLIRIVYIHEVIQHSITETAKELSSYSYILSVCGIADINASVNNAIEQTMDQKLEQFTQAYQSFSASNVNDGLFENPISQLRNILTDMSDSAFENGKTGLMLPVIKGVMKKYLKNNNMDAEKRLKNLGIVDSFDGLDFTQSRIMEDNKNLDIYVSYRVKSFLPIKYLSVFHIKQRAFVRAWMDGEDDAANIAEDHGNNPQCSSNAGAIADEVKIVELDPWQLANIPRGKKIEEIMGGNLGQYFPTIDKLENRTVYRIVSYDTAALTYQRYAALYKSIEADINELAKFKKGKKSGVEVQQKDYDNKIMNIAIPDKDLNEEQLKAIADIKIYARQKGISFKITVIKPAQ